MYDFDAGDLSLNFANTKEWHASSKPVENLHSLADLLTWGEQAGLVLPEQASRLRHAQDDSQGEGRRAYEAAIQLREAIYRIFSHHYADMPIPDVDLQLLNTTFHQAMQHLQLVPRKGEITWEWSAKIGGANLILWPVARAAAELLTSDKASRVRMCEDDRGCGYLFIDQTKNHSRRWCSMESCGNRAKARRHYSRVQAK